MTSARAIRTLVLCTTALVAGGCRTGEVFYRSLGLGQAVSHGRVGGGSDRIDTVDGSALLTEQWHTRRLASAGVPSRSTRPASVGSRPTTAPAEPVTPSTRPAPKRSFTAPSDWVRRASLMLAPFVWAQPQPVTGGGKEAAESSLVGSGLAGSLRVVLGQPGLTAPQPRTLNAVNSRSGLHRGFAAGIGFAAGDTILSRRSSPVAGPCGDLVRAGFFPNQATCQARVGRR